MGRLIARLGDSSNHSAVIDTSNQDGTVFCEGKEIAVDGATLVSHFSEPEHTAPAITINLATKLFINNRAVVLHDSIADCGAVIIAGSTKTYGS